MPDDRDRDALSEQLGGAYQIVRELGRGAFATVYLARERVLHRLVAIKVLRLDRAVSDEERERFMREARTAAHLDHPGIIPVLAFGETPATMYMVMRYIAGESLADRLGREKRLPPDEVRRLLLDVASALAHAHRQGVVHRDIKPENVLLTTETGEGDDARPRTRARLLDFGVAAFQTRDLGMAGSREMWGTPTFMSPEQALGEVDLDVRSDIYSLGVMGYVMLAGRDPFPGKGPLERLKEQQRGPGIPLARAAPGAAAGLVAAIERCLAYEPGERWRRAADLCDALAALGDDAAARRRTLPGWRRAVARVAGAPAAARRRRARRAAFFRPLPAPRLVLEALRDDVRYTVRGLAKSPGFAAAAVLTFALGVGANATMFGVIDRLLLRPPAHVSEPRRVVRLVARRSGETRGGQQTFSYPVYKAVRDRVPGFEHVAMAWNVGVPLGRGEQAQGLRGLLVSASYFPLLGVRPQLGRLILREEDVEPVGAPVVVISHGFWTRHFAGDRRVVGRTLDLGQRRYTIVGVTPRGFTGTELSEPDVWIPITAAQGLQPFVGWDTRGGSATWLSIFARLRRGVPPEAVGAETMRVMREAAPGAFYAGPNRRIVADPIITSRAESAGVGSKVTTLLGAMSGLVLVIACANVVNLLLARGLRRRREIAVRLALGVSRGRLVGQLIAESVLLAVIGGVAALLVAYWGGAVVRSLLFGDIAWADSPVDRRVLGFTMLLAVTGGILAGLVPSIQASHPDLTRALKAGAREGGGQRSRTRTALLVVQTALSVVLLAGTGLFVRSLARISEIRLGVDVDRVLLGTMNLRAAGRSSADADAIFSRILERVRALPGVQSAAVAATVPFSESFGVSVVVPGRRPELAERDRDEPNFHNAVTPGYFATIGAPLLAGRDFTEADHAASARVVIVSDAMARWYWPGESAVGKCVRLGGDTMPCAQVVGVAANVKREGIFEQARRFVYTPLAQAPEMRARRLVVRPAGDDPSRLVEPVRRAMQTAVPGLPYARVALLRDLSNVREQLRPWHLGASFFGAFGALALLLAGVGLYGVVSYMVTQRTHEMGVRVALGAQARQVARLVMGEGVAVTAVGVAIGVAAALAGGRVVQDLLYEVSARDPLVFSAVAAMLLSVAVAATLAPAWRAMRVDPVVALRAE